jgi:hypothetical protein
MKATCPNNQSHKLFTTVVHVTQEWVVDETGSCREVANLHDSEVVHGPEADNTWRCLACGAEAEVEP